MLGRQLAHNLERRPAQLRDCLAALQALETEIHYAATPLPEALQRAAAGAGGLVGHSFAQAADTVRRGEPAAAAWERLLTALERLTALVAADTAVLAPLGLQLGMTGTADQLRHLQLARAGLERQLGKAEAEAARLGRLYRYAGPLTGCAVVVLLL